MAPGTVIFTAKLMFRLDSAGSLSQEDPWRDRKELNPTNPVISQGSGGRQRTRGRRLISVFILKLLWT